MSSSSHDRYKDENIMIKNHHEGYSRALDGSGVPLPVVIKSFFEARLGHDFTKVRIHHDAASTESAQLYNALAYTRGNNIVFGAGEYQPGTYEGKKLLAYELVHTVQQSKGAVQSGTVQKKEKIPTDLPCTPTPLSRSAYLKQTGDTDFGSTDLIHSQADFLSAPYVEFEPVGKKIKMKPLSLNPPKLSSVFTGPGMFIEGKTKNQITGTGCPLDFYDIRYNISPTGADSLKEAEQEHCNDFNYAYKTAVYPFLIHVNNAADKNKTFTDTIAADKYLKSKLKFDPHDWYSKFDCMVGNTTIRDLVQNGVSRAWHDPEPILQLLPSSTTNCAHVTMLISPASFIGLNNQHPSDVVAPSNC